MKVDIIKELADDRIVNDHHTKKTIKIILEKCIKFIKMINKAGKTNCVYEIPCIVSGQPMYSIQQITLAVNKHLKKMNFNTTYINPNKLYITW